MIRYGSVSEEKPWRLLDCTRGAFDTKATFHKKGDSIAKLADHAYRVFLTNPELSIEMAQNISRIFIIIMMAMHQHQILGLVEGI